MKDHIAKEMEKILKTVCAKQKGRIDPSVPCLIYVNKSGATDHPVLTPV